MVDRESIDVGAAARGERSNHIGNTNKKGKPMSFLSGIGDLLKQYSGSSATSGNEEQHFDQVAQAVRDGRGVRVDDDQHAPLARGGGEERVARPLSRRWRFRDYPQRLLHRKRT